MGFDGKTPKPGTPINSATVHKHKFYDEYRYKWIERECWCATGINHTTKRQR